MVTGPTPPGTGVTAPTGGPSAKQFLVVVAGGAPRSKKIGDDVIAYALE